MSALGETQKSQRTTVRPTPPQQRTFDNQRGKTEKGQQSWDWKHPRGPLGLAFKTRLREINSANVFQAAERFKFSAKKCLVADWSIVSEDKRRSTNVVGPKSHALGLTSIPTSGAAKRLPWTSSRSIAGLPVAKTDFPAVSTARSWRMSLVVGSRHDRYGSNAFAAAGVVQFRAIDLPVGQSHRNSVKHVR
jgi:hypothetical protein